MVGFQHAPARFMLNSRCLGRSQEHMIMGYVILPVRPLDYPYRTLIITFAVWKLFLLLVAIASPGDGYDTSTTLLRQSSGTVSTNGSFLKGLLLTIANRLTRWDAIHFTGIAKHGYVFEQQWAFGWGINYPMTLGTYGELGLRQKLID